MEQVVIYCDLCKEPDARKYDFPTDDESDGNGGHDLTHKRVDLCPSCSAKQLYLFVLALPWKARQKFAADILKDKKLYLSHMCRQERMHGIQSEETKVA